MRLQDYGDDAQVKRIKKLAKEVGVKQCDIAQGIGLSKQVFSAKMNGRRALTLRDISRIADFFDVSVDFLLGRSDYAKPLEVA
ncbi:MAG: helix-turn-helix transcriptional regulator [Bifidobacterium scardovii]|uniref:helix-turn-helix domain-containing protein n=1 Tax=Bifidobacterium scardovii TaxID=158787 RepID=UPI0028FEA88B|nr:helix-turn-helix transcriptional regulator [Bifidobacterium scardovii]MDU2421554.1 helix-turn-helix transcriptional regulator [Bifidobacterium scardovii]